TFSGLIQTNAGGLLESRSVRNSCVTPARGTTTAVFTLDQATIGGRTGGVILEATGVFEATAPTETSTRLHFTVRGVSGGLKGAHGGGQAVGTVTATSSVTTYYAEIFL